MSPNILSILKKILTGYQIEKKSVEIMCVLFSHYKKNDWVYPGVLERKCKISSITIYSILNEMEKQGVLDSYYDVSCPKCGRTVEIYRYIEEMPNVLFCNDCLDEINAPQNSYLVYKVL